MKCYQCDSEEITYYKQRRKDGVVVVTARCENGHSPVKGKPFYPIVQFDLSALSFLPDTEPEEKTQQSLFQSLDEVLDVVQLFEQTRQKNNTLFPRPK